MILWILLSPKSFAKHGFFTIWKWNKSQVILSSCFHISQLHKSVRLVFDKLIVVNLTQSTISLLLFDKKSSPISSSSNIVNFVIPYISPHLVITIHIYRARITNIGKNEEMSLRHFSILVTFGNFVVVNSHLCDITSFWKENPAFCLYLNTPDEDLSTMCQYNHFHDYFYLLCWEGDPNPALTVLNYYDDYLYCGGYEDYPVLCLYSYAMDNMEKCEFNHYYDYYYKRCQGRGFTDPNPNQDLFNSYDEPADCEYDDYPVKCYYQNLDWEGEYCEGNLYFDSYPVSLS